jgi:membrane-bound lytic murein transglycosylase A
MRYFISGLALLALGACATTQTPAPPAKPQAPARTAPPAAEAPTFVLRPATFADLPGWAAGDPTPALIAFRQSCTALTRRPDDQAFGRSAPYGGKVSDWRGVCAEAATIALSADAAKAFFERAFVPQFVEARPDQMSKLTGYYEPIIMARRSPQPGFTEPFLGRPTDLVSIDFQAFDEEQKLSDAIAEDVTKGLSNDVAQELRPAIQATLDDRLTRRFRTPFWGQLTQDGRSVRPFPTRADIKVMNRAALAYAHPADVYDTQVQGSARVQFEDGAQQRMAYDSQNGWRWNSIFGQLRARGDLQVANKRAVKAWMDTQTPEGVRAAMDLDPSYVFFRLEPIGDPSLGPKGAQGVPLTPLGSMAVDPVAHPYGGLIYVDGTGPNAAGAQAPFQRLMAAQDTGGAIRRGPLRGDVFFGTGDAALALAEKMNAPARFWTLLPRTLAEPRVASAANGPG